MSPNLAHVLTFPVRNARSFLVMGLLAGIALPDLALGVRAWLPHIVAVMVFLAAFRVGFRQTLGTVRRMRAALAMVTTMQLAMPLLAMVAVSVTGVAGTIPAAALILTLSASPIFGSPNLAIITGNNPALALRLMTLGAAILPVTVVVPFWLFPAFGSIEEVIAVSLRLIFTLGVAAGGAFILRAIWVKNLDTEQMNLVDSASVLAMAVIVIGLMSAVGPMMTQAPVHFFFWLAMAFAVSFGVQLVSYWAIGLTPLKQDAASFAICAGNRNIALFLVALPEDMLTPLLAYIGCYQIPMYLTPVFMSRLYRPVNESK